MEHDFTPEDAAPWPGKVEKPVLREADEAPAAAAPAATAPAEAPAPAARSRTDLLLGGIVVLLTAGGTLALLVAREDPTAAYTRAPHTAAKRAVASSTAWAATAPRWTANSDAWLGRTKGIAYEVSAAEPVGVWMRAVRPALVVRCAGARAEVFVFTDSAAKIEANTDDHTVEYAFDDEEPTTMRWPDGAEHNALFAPDGGAMAQRLRSARTFTFHFDPHNAPRVTARFNTTGLQKLLAPATKHCGK